MTAKPKRDGATVVGLGAAACVACCAGPILAFLGGIGRGFEEFEAGVMVAVGTIGCGDERALINDQHWSIATEPVGEEFVDLVADAVLARPDSSEAQVPSAWRGRDGGDVVGEHFGGEFLDRDPARCCGCLQAASYVVGNVHGHRHDTSLCAPSRVLLRVPTERVQRVTWHLNEIPRAKKWEGSRKFCDQIVTTA